MNVNRIRQNAIIKGHPFLTSIRWVKWIAHCIFRVPAVVKFTSIDRKLFLLPRLKNFGSTSIFIKREYYEPELLIIRHFVTRDNMAIDIGGSFGIYTIFLSELVGPQGMVVTFEPGDFSFSLLSKNMKLNNLENVSIHKLALSDAAGSVPLYHIENSPVNFSLGGANGVESEMVPAARLDEIMDIHDGRVVSFIKIDVEGYEAIVFEGARVTIESMKPVIMFEVAHSAISRARLEPSAPYTFLSEIGYLFYQYSDAGKFISCVAPQEGNIFAVHKEHLLRYPFLLEEASALSDIPFPNSLPI